MFQITKYRPAVIVNLNNGLYQFICESSTGKTRLYHVLREYSRAGEEVVAYSYNDYTDGLDFRSMVSRIKPKLVLVDRYGMYANEYKDLILELSLSGIVLIDSKEMLRFGENDRVCGIDMSPERIEVYG